MAKTQVRSSDGKVVVNADGKVVMADPGVPCCCGDGGLGCPVCLTVAATQYTVTFSGQSSDGCLEVGSDEFYRQNGSINETVVLDYDAITSGTLNGCVWKGASSVTLDHFASGDDDCSGSVSENLAATIYFGWFSPDGGLTYRMFLSIQYSAGGNDIRAFNHTETVSVPLDCLEGWTFSNDTIDSYMSGSGGSADVTPV